MTHLRRRQRRAPQPDPPLSATFQTATADGAQAFFISPRSRPTTPTPAAAVSAGDRRADASDGANANYSLVPLSSTPPSAMASTSNTSTGSTWAPTPSAAQLNGDNPVDDFIPASTPLRPRRRRARRLLDQPGRRHGRPGTIARADLTGWAQPGALQRHPELHHRPHRAGGIHRFQLRLLEEQQWPQRLHEVSDIARANLADGNGVNLNFGGRRRPTATLPSTPTASTTPGKAATSSASTSTPAGKMMPSGGLASPPSQPRPGARCRTDPTSTGPTPRTTPSSATTSPVSTSPAPPTWTSTATSSSSTRKPGSAFMAPTASRSPSPSPPPPSPARLLRRRRRLQGYLYVQNSDLSAPVVTRAAR